jgi:hypothetical protein
MSDNYWEKEAKLVRRNKWLRSAEGLKSIERARLAIMVAEKILGGIRGVPDFEAAMLQNSRMRVRIVQEALLDWETANRLVEGESAPETDLVELRSQAIAEQLHRLLSGPARPPSRGGRSVSKARRPRRLSSQKSNNQRNC